MRNSRHLDHSHYLVTALWALIFAKCFFEYLICNYAVPGNSALFIWSLSILMSTVATIVYFSVQNGRKALSSVYYSLGKTWSVCGIIIGVILSGAYFINSISVSILPACIAIILSLVISLNQYKLEVFASYLVYWVGLFALH